jgi:hypothetical protein
MIHRLPDNDARAIERLLLILGFFSSPGPGTLADLLRTSHPGGEGGYQLLCSPTVDVATLKTFNYAAPWPRDDYEPVNDMVRIMRDYLAQTPGGCLVTQESSGDNAFAELRVWDWSPPPWHCEVTAGGVRTLYYFATAADKDDSLRLQDIGNLTCAFALAVLSRSETLRSGVHAPHVDLAELVANAWIVVVSALDGQGMLMWQPAGARGLH